MCNYGSMLRAIVVLVLVIAAGVGLRHPVSAQADHGEIAAAGDHYSAGLLHRWVLGRHYRDLWTAIIEVELLDLSSFAGGLEPLRTGGGQQTRSLRLVGADGREYSFRSVDKDPSAVLDTLLRGTIIDDLVQDGISAAHPYGALVAGPLLEAVGVLHAEPLLRLMPDDPALGEFRSEFAGMLGLIEEQPDENSGGGTSFEGTASVIASERLTERLLEGPEDQVDARAFLTARLMDVFLGDWDRHRGQWRWAVYGDEEARRWLPIPRDRDQAFSKFDGLATRVVSIYMPQFVAFGDAYPDITRLHWNGRALDRWFLSGLGREVWDSVGVSVKERVTDDVIERAVRQLPPEIQAINGDGLSRSLRSRRDHLDEAWDDFYRLLAEKVDIHATDADDVVEVDRSVPGRVLVTVTAPGVLEGAYFERSFDAAETAEIRIYLHDGDDRVMVEGSADPGIVVRVVGGKGDDQYDVNSGPGTVHMYDYQGGNGVAGSGGEFIDDSEFVDWVWTEEDRDQPRDWGGRRVPVLWSSYSSDLGPVLGGGIRLQRFGFRKRPYASEVTIRGSFAPTTSKGRGEAKGRLTRENSNVFLEVDARVSRLDVIKYFGLGNTSDFGASDFHKVDQTSMSVGAGLGLRAGPSLTMTGGMFLERVSTQDNEGRYFRTLGTVYGGEGFVQLGATASIEWKPLEESVATANRFRLNIEGTSFPGVADAERSYASGQVLASALLASSAMPVVALAVAAGAKQVWGRFPWFEAAFLGGPQTLRGWDEGRFAGDASLYGTAEVRVRLARPRVIVPVSFGGFGFVDGGRVSVDGASLGGWHTSLGGGIWMQPLQSALLLRAGFAVGDEATKIMVGLGLPY